jgi:hypothetical protein
MEARRKVVGDGRSARLAATSALDKLGLLMEDVIPPQFNISVLKDQAHRESL